MDANLHTLENHIVLLSDDRFLLELVGANLTALSVCTLPLLCHTRPALPAPGVIPAASACRLVVLALSCSSNEPVIALAQAGLTALIGAVPLLIISDRPFAADPERNIFHLPFPFRADALHRCIAALLHKSDAASSIESRSGQ